MDIVVLLCPSAVYAFGQIGIISTSRTRGRFGGKPASFRTPHALQRCDTNAYKNRDVCRKVQSRNLVLARGVGADFAVDRICAKRGRGASPIFGRLDGSSSPCPPASATRAETNSRSSFSLQGLQHLRPNLHYMICCSTRVRAAENQSALAIHRPQQ